MSLNYKYVTDEEGVRKALEYIQNLKYIVIDTETTGLDVHTAKIHCIQIGDKRQQFVLDYVRTRGYLGPLQQMFQDPKYYWVGQNIKYDYKIIKKAFGVGFKNMLDTMLAEQILTNGRKSISAALDALAKKYLGMELDKDVRGSFAEHSYGMLLNTTQQKYAAMDVYVPLPILSKQIKLLTKNGLMDVFDLECMTVKPTGEMEYNGIFLDADAWKALYTKSAEDAETAKKILDSYFLDYCQKDLFGYPIINYNSPVQLMPILKEITGRNITKTDKATLERLAENHEVAKVLLQYRAAVKQHTTYGPEFLNNINKMTGRVHSSYAQLRSEQGRYASSDPNMQNIPAKKEFRACFRPQDISSRVMYTADYSGCELRLLAELSGDPKFQRIFNEGLDPHIAVACELTGQPYNKDMSKEERKPYKAINFGVIYGMGPKKLSGQLDIPLDTAADLIKSWYASFPSVKAFLDEVAYNAEVTHQAVSTLDGRIRHLDTMDWDDKGHVAHAKNVAKNMPFQGGNASMIKRGMCILYDKIEKQRREDLELVACVHDEFVAEGDRDKLEEGKELVVSSMIEAGEYYVKSVPMVVDVDVGDHWIK